MSGNDDRDNNDQYETSTGQSPALMRSIKTRGCQEVPVKLNKVKEYVEQFICLLGQATNSMTYHRRCNILSALNCAPQQSKEMLREEADFLEQQDKNLSDCNWIRTHNHLAHKRTLNHLAKLAK